MIDDLLRTLVHSTNAAADEVLVDALRLGTVNEQRVILAALLARQSVPGLVGVVEHYEKLAEPLQLEVLQNIKDFHGAIREAGRSAVAQQRLSAIKLIAQGRQGRLCYVLSENLHAGDERFSKAAAAAMTALARWIWRAQRLLQWGEVDEEAPLVMGSASVANTPTRAQLYQDLIDNRPEVEAAIVRALELHRGSRQQELIHAAMMLCDSAQSVAIRVLTTAKHGGQTPMLRRIQQTPEPEHVAAFLLGATHGGLRATFGPAFSKIEQAPALEQLLRKTHWLKDPALQLCMRQVTSGVWWNDLELPTELARRTPTQIALIGEWLAASGLIDQQLEPKLEQLYVACGDNFDARLRIVRLIAKRPSGASVALLPKLLSDSDERIVRIAARELIRRRPRDYEHRLLPLMGEASQSVRNLISRAIGRTSFETYWNRFEQMDVPTRRSAGRALMKLLPDGTQRLAQRISGGEADQRIKAMQIALELDLVVLLRAKLLPLVSHANVRVRSKAVTLLGELGVPAADVLIEKAVNDADARVRANAIEAMESRGNGTKFIAVLTDRARTGHNRERANAIKALHQMRLGVAGPSLLEMLRDDRADHRVSALWLLRKIGWWRLLAEVAKLAREDGNVRVRRYAMGVLQTATVELRSGRTA